MIIDATFWVAISFFVFLIALAYLKVPQKINTSLSNQIKEIGKELGEAENIRLEAKNLLIDYENKIDKSKKETKAIIDLAKKNSEENVLEKTEKFYQLMEDKKRNTEKKIVQMKEDALKEIKKISIKISIESVENILKNSIDKQKIENFNLKSLELAKKALKQTTT
tara:strand:+ start:2584 stop:3081 length:498 start_codon:yes stop_codon:yes gene_type:complete